MRWDALHYNSYNALPLQSVVCGENYWIFPLKRWYTFELEIWKYHLYSKWLLNNIGIITDEHVANDIVDEFDAEDSYI